MQNGLKHGMSKNSTICALPSFCKPSFGFLEMTMLMPSSTPALSNFRVDALWSARRIVTILPFFVSNVAYWLAEPLRFAPKAAATSFRKDFF